MSRVRLRRAGSISAEEGLSWPTSRYLGPGFSVALAGAPAGKWHHVTGYDPDDGSLRFDCPEPDISWAIDWHRVVGGVALVTAAAGGPVPGVPASARRSSPRWRLPCWPVADLRVPEPLVIPWQGRQLRVRHDDPHTTRGAQVGRALAMAGEAADAALAALLGAQET